jgi:hypothetical protein
MHIGKGVDVYASLFDRKCQQLLRRLSTSKGTKSSKKINLVIVIVRIFKRSPHFEDV